jgi:hypothetical protein
MSERRNVLHEIELTEAGPEDCYSRKHYPQNEYPWIDYGDVAKGGMRLVDFIAGVQKAADMVPEQYRSEAQIRTIGGGEYGNDDDVRVVISYVHPETDAQWQARIAREKADIADSEARDRAQFERLRKKFG